jgi:type II secretory pathway component GspD/PulD (secretin)
MRRFAARLGIAALFLSLAFGQSPDRVLSFTHSNTAQGYQEIGNAIRSVAEVQGSVDAERKTLSVSGAPEKLAVAAWLFSQLDAPAAVGRPGTPQSMPGIADNNLRIYRLVNANTPTALQELLNATRSVVEINRMFPIASQSAIILRGTEEQVKAADFLIGELDKPAGKPLSNPPAYPYQPGNNQPADVIRVFYLKNIQTPTQLQETVNAVRSLAEINRMFPFGPLNAIMARASEGQMAATEWLIQQLDRPVRASGQPAPAEPAMSEYRIPQASWGRDPGDQVAMRIFRLANADAPQALQSITNAVRASTKCNRIFPVGGQKAIVLRGTETQAFDAQALIKQMDVPAPKP